MIIRGNRDLGLTRTTDNTEVFKKALKRLVSQEVLVGVPNTNADRQPDPNAKSTPNNATIAYVQEFGSPAKNIPARPFLLPGIRSAEEPIAAQMKKAGEAALKIDNAAATTGAVDQALHQVGLVAQNAVRAKITDGPFASLSPQTIARRKSRGRDGDKPLIDTGQLRASLTYVIRQKG